MPGIPSFTVESLGQVWDPTANGGLGDWVKATAASGGSGGGLTDAQLRASAVPVSGTVTASGPLTETQLRASAVAVSGTVGVTNFPATQPVSGTVSVGNFPATQPVSIATMPSTPVTGTFFQGTQPVSAASLPLPAGAATETTLAATSGKLPATLGQKAMAASLAVVVASDQGAIPTTKQPTGGTNVLKTGTLTTTAVTADQVVLTYTVTALKTFYLCYLVMYGRLTVPAAAAAVLGAISLETPSGTKVLTLDAMNPTTSELEFNPITFSEPIPMAAGVVVRVVVTPAAATSMLWRANVGGYEK